MTEFETAALEKLDTIANVLKQIRASLAIVSEASQIEVNKVRNMAKMGQDLKDMIGGFPRPDKE